MKLSAPIKIRTLQRKLYIKAKQEPDFRFYALYDKLSRADILSHAYELARANQGAPGIDGRTFEAIEAQEGKTEFLACLQEELIHKTYRAEAVRRVWIPKPDGSKRPLGIPSMSPRYSQWEIRRRQFSLYCRALSRAERRSIRSLNTEVPVDTAMGKRRAGSLGNSHVRFGGRRLATQVRLCAGRLSYLVICCAGDVQAPMGVLRYVLGRLDLSLNETKTRLVDAQTESFDFLGFSFHVRRGHKSGKRYPHVQPSKRSIQRIKDRTKQLTDRRRTPVPLPQLMGELNRTVSGWSNYFHHRNCTGVFSEVKMYVEERVRTQRRRRYKLASRAQAYERFPGRVLYARYALFKLPTTAPWRSAHASV